MQTQDVPYRRASVKTGAVVGLLAGIVMALVMLAMRLLLGTPSLPEAIADWSTTLVPPALFSLLLDTLLTAAKPLLFTGLLLLQLLLAAGAGALYASLSNQFPGLRLAPWRWGTVFALVLWVATGLVLSPLIGVGLMGAQLEGGVGPFVTSTLVMYLAFGFTLAYGQSRFLAAGESVKPVALGGRRLFLKRATVGVVALVGAGAVGRLIQVGLSNVTPSRYTPTSALSPEITPNDQFYTVSKNIIDPTVEAASWTMEVTGLVDRPYTLGLEELRALTGQEEYVTLECISNPIGGALISNALWGGVPLGYFLERADMQPGIRRVVFRAADGYSDSLPLEQALNHDVMVAYEMNGEPLTRKHGAPARLLVPGRFGLKSVKWLTQIELTAEEYRGYWQRRGWSDEALVKTMSRIDTPGDGESLLWKRTNLGGIAYAGDRGISQVEISTDNGVTWTGALLGEALSPYTWVLWNFDWLPPDEGSYELLVRATDGQGKLQVARHMDAIPDGATGYHRLRLTFG